MPLIPGPKRQRQGLHSQTSSQKQKTEKAGCGCRHCEVEAGGFLWAEGQSGWQSSTTARTVKNHRKTVSKPPRPPPPLPPPPPPAKRNEKTEIKGNKMANVTWKGIPLQQSANHLQSSGRRQSTDTRHYITSHLLWQPGSVVHVTQWCLNKALD